MIRLMLCLSLLAIAFTSSASEYVCTHGTSTRTISVDYQADPEPVPCRVKYDKSEEGGVQYPWNAKNQAGFCEQKAAELAERLRSYGWDCERQAPEIGVDP